jgi:hypothetical protein
MTEKVDGDLSSLMAYIGARYTFTPEYYPLLAKVGLAERQPFAISHSIMHLQKSLGQIAAESESHDHGGPMDINALEVATTKLLVSTLKLAEELGMTAERLSYMIPQVMKSK